MIFDFCEPVTWSDVIAMVTIVITLITAVVAIFMSVKGNKLSYKQLQASQQQLNDALKIHEQSKNIELFDRRMEVFTKLGESYLSACKIDNCEMLFDDEIYKKYMSLFNGIEKYKKLKLQIELYTDDLAKQYYDGNRVLAYQEIVQKKIFKSKEAYIQNKSEENLKNYSGICGKYQIMSSNSIILNFKIIDDEMELLNEKLKLEIGELRELIKKYIIKSIQPIKKDII